jgi:hypothetical protein
MSKPPRSGVVETVPYSLSRYTDLPAAKWSWFESCLAAEQMIAFDSKTGAPSVWSLAPEETLALVFWTKNPTNLIASQLRLKGYNVVIHMTATGWREVEKGTPTINEAGRLLVEAVKAFGNVHWRFSPIPLLSTQMVLERFRYLLEYAHRAGRREVFVSFLQPNDSIPETRSCSERFELLNRLAEIAAPAGIQVMLCKDDRSFDDWQGAQFLLAPCVPASDFSRGGLALESCECVAMVDPFTLNESCLYGCQYCYAGDKSLAPKKRNTNRGLTVIRGH